MTEKRRSSSFYSCKVIATICLHDCHIIAYLAYITVFSAMNTDNNNMEGDNGKKCPFTDSSIDDSKITIVGSVEKKKKEESTLAVVELDPDCKFANAWRALQLNNNTGNYYEPMEKQVKLVIKENCSPSKVYSDFGNNKKACIHCIENTANELCLFATTLDRSKKDGGEMKRKEKFTNIQVRKHLYANFAENEYSYIRKVRNCIGLPCIPLPWCFEQGVKKAFPNLPGQAYVGYKSSRARGKK